jgi:stage II sporulation protein D (peptidoglycan lytic transglycosylase)
MKLRVLIPVVIALCFVSFALTRGNKKPAADLQTIATATLGEREGTIIAIDPQTGRIRALVNPEVAFQRALPPGSTIKPFTTVAALRAGIIDEKTRIACNDEEKNNDDVPACSHPRELPPFTPAEAIAYSCNNYFARAGAGLDRDEFARTLTEFGFGEKTGIDSAEEATGAIVRAKWDTNSAIGEGEFLQVTPIQLLMAYTALLNSGKLFTPALTSSKAPHLRSQLQIANEERAIVLAGMRGAVRFGTAQKAGLAGLPGYVVGKTGTSTPLRGFRSQGWFVGFSFAPGKPPEPENLQLAVIVYLKKAHGAEAAQVAAPLFRESIPENETVVTENSSPSSLQPKITVRHHADNATRELSLDDYVAHVVAVEGGTENEPEALKALAIAVRTFALKNLGRHREQGYDFCNTTHCQRFEPAEPAPAVVTAVNATSNLILNDERGAIADSYFGASCGGMTANLETLWGKPAPKYLTGVRDDYCNAGFHSEWKDVITPDRLLTALRSDPRTDVGETIRELNVAKRDETGRAELVSIAGKQKRVISGWEFKLIVGRALGWNVLKSSRFSISRSGSAFVFRGSGFGHGLGLCQEGSHVMAQRGYNYRQILAKYFPGTSLGPPNALKPSPVSKLSSSHFTITAPDRNDAGQVMGLLESQRSVLLRRLSAAGVDVNIPDVEIVFNKTTGDFVGRTGMPPWAAAATRNNRIELQPLSVLKQRGILETTLRHELVHVVIDAVGGAQTPRWFAEGIALYVSGEGKQLERYAKGPLMSPSVLEQKLASARSAEEMKTAYAAAYKTVQDLVRVEGENKLWKRVAQRSYDVKVSGSSS